MRTQPLKQRVDEMFSNTGSIKISLLGLALFALAGCTTNTYIAPSEQSAPQSYLEQAPIKTSRVVAVGIDQAWKNIQAFSTERYQTRQQNRADGTMTLFVDAYDPSRWINCGMVQNQGGSFTTDTTLLSLLGNEVPVNLDLTLTIKLTPESAKQTQVTVNGIYDLAVNYKTNPSTGAIIGGQQYQFDSNGSAAVTAPGSGLTGLCRPTGNAEIQIFQAASDPR